MGHLRGVGVAKKERMSDLRGARVKFNVPFGGVTGKADQVACVPRMTDSSSSGLTSARLSTFRSYRIDIPFTVRLTHITLFPSTFLLLTATLRRISSSLSNQSANSSRFVPSNSNAASIRSLCVISTCSLVGAGARFSASARAERARDAASSFARRVLVRTSRRGWRAASSSSMMSTSNRRRFARGREEATREPGLGAALRFAAAATASGSWNFRVGRVARSSRRREASVCAMAAGSCSGSESVEAKSDAKMSASSAAAEGGGLSVSETRETDWRTRPRTLHHWLPRRIPLPLAACPAPPAGPACGSRRWGGGFSWRRACCGGRGERMEARREE